MNAPSSSHPKENLYSLNYVLSTGDSNRKGWENSVQSAFKKENRANKYIVQSSLVIPYGISHFTACKATHTSIFSEANSSLSPVPVSLSPSPTIRQYFLEGVTFAEGICSRRLPRCRPPTPSCSLYDQRD